MNLFNIFKKRPAVKAINSQVRARQEMLGSMKTGGKVKKTGPYKLHKGEKVLTVKQARKMPLAKLERRLK